MPILFNNGKSRRSSPAPVTCTSFTVVFANISGLSFGPTAGMSSGAACFTCHDTSGSGKALARSKSMLGRRQSTSTLIGCERPSTIRQVQQYPAEYRRPEKNTKGPAARFPYFASRAFRRKESQSHRQPSTHNFRYPLRSCLHRQAHKYILHNRCARDDSSVNRQPQEQESPLSAELFQK